MDKLKPLLRFPEFKEDWSPKKLSQVANIGRGKSKHRPRDAAHLYGGPYPFIQTGDIRNAGLYLSSFSQTYSEAGLKQSKLWDENTLCITIAANIAETTILKIKACFPDSVIGLIPNEKDSIVLFIKYQFDKFKIEIQSLSQGVAQANLNQEKLSNIVFKFPEISEQTKIATFLSAVDEKLNFLKDKKEALEEYKKGMMQKIFSQEIRFKGQNGKDFAKWEVKMLSEIAEFRRGSFPQPYGLKKWYDEINGMPFIQVYDVDDNMRLKSTTKSKISQLGAKQSVFVERGSLVITIQGSIGRIAKTQYDAYVDRTLLIFQSYKLPIDIDYFKYVVFLLFEIEKTKAPGGIIKTITKEVLSSFNIMLPQIEEQTKIASFLSAIDEKITLVSKQIDETQEYKKGLLQQMFV